MNKIILLVILGLLPCFGCRWTGSQTYPNQPYGQPPVLHQGPLVQPGYEQTFPPQQAQGYQQPAMGQFGNRAGQFVGSLASGFLRSAVGGAGFTAGRDLWNEIVR